MALFWKRVSPSSRLAFGLALGLALALGSPANADLIHQYNFSSGTLADSVGSQPLTSGGGTVTPGNYAFGPNQGPSLGSWLTGTATAGNYALELIFNLTSISPASGFSKLIDFANRTSDNGLYVNNQGVAFVSDTATTGSPTLVPNGAFTHLLIQRDGGTNQVSVYVNTSSSLLTFNDSLSHAVFSGPNNIINLFKDDTITNTEAASGNLKLFNVYSAPLTQGQIDALFAVPEPGPLMLSGVLVLTALGGACLRRRMQTANPA